MLYSTAQFIVHAVRRHKTLLLSMIDSPVLVLLYHRVTTLPSDPQLLAVSPDNFLSQMMYLKDRFPLVRFEEDWSHISRPSIAVTFDDGYADNALIALPILEKVGVPATFFVSTGHIDTGYEYWWDEIERLILETEALPESFTLKDLRFGKCWDTRNFSARKDFYTKLQVLMKNLDIESRSDWLSQLRLWAGSDSAGLGVNRSMSGDEIKRLARSKLVTVGAHTVNHLRLSILPGEQQRKEIVSSKQQLESLLGAPVRTFSYPYGRRRDYDRTSVEICRDAGFSKVAANYIGLAYRWTDQLQVPRYLVRNWDRETFATKIKALGMQ